MSFSPIIRVRKLLDKMKSERESSGPRLKRFPSRTLSDEYGLNKSGSDSATSSPVILPFRKYIKVTENREDFNNNGDIDVLPSEAKFVIFSFLESKDLSRARLVSKEWCEFADDNLIWKKLCLDDFNVTAPILGDSWKNTYYRIDELFADGVWEGMSKWIEPEGYDNEQKTTARLHFLKRNRSPAANLLKSSWSSSPSIRRVNSASIGGLEKTLEEPPKTKEPAFKIIGSGVTINCSSPSPFKIEGERSGFTENGTSFHWSKHFERHTSVYTGKLDFTTGIVSGTICYNDGTTNWRGLFQYSKVNSKRPFKYQQTQVNA